ncbi:lysoplasmalogenase [Paenibacillus sp. MER 180]|uniref:lysoplasmalogenase n=1 Tax=Paenibacillus sp. MER 180 TaxID=2939570 RepID=UPI0020421E32|nr:lysoplasmalogenase [Paenibacillus sp. MER 180]MCM3288941.1 lysoplasmalogenase [Paenibacillus sp. MER 180]
MLRKWLIVAILVTGMIHLATLSLDSSVLNWIFKLLPMVLIIVLAVSSQPADKLKMYKVLVVIGLVFSIAGDALLLNNGNEWFMLGLFSFLVGHLFYVAAMIRRWEFSLLTLVCVIPIGLYSWLIGWQLNNGIMANSGNSDLWLPVAVYVSVISLMCWAAIMSRNWYAAVGAILFAASDSILAWNKFVSDVPASGIWIMLTYFAAQLFIAGSIAKVFGGKQLSKGRAARM